MTKVAINVLNSWLPAAITVVVVGSISWTTVAYSSDFIPTTSIEPQSITGLRSFSSSAASGFLLEFGAVKSIDRTVAHFALPEIPDTWRSATLRIPIKNIDPGDPLGDLDVYSFFGDGVVSGDEWSAGSLYHRITGIDGGLNTGPDVRDYDPLVFAIDITPLIRTGIENDEDFVSFVFRPGQSSDRYWMAPNTGTPAPVIDVRLVPEPAGTCLVGGCVVFFLWRHRRGEAR